jgi:hypothetical protein
MVLSFQNPNMAFSQEGNDLLQSASSFIATAEEAIPSSSGWKAVGSLGGWVATGRDIAAAPGRTQKGESRERILAGLMVGNFVDLQLMKEVVPRAARLSCQNGMTGRANQAKCIGGIALAVGSSIYLSSTAEKQAEEAVTQIQTKTSTGFKAVTYYEIQDGHLQATEPRDEPCLPIEAGVKESIKMMFGEPGQGCKILAEEETDRNINRLTQCVAYNDQGTFWAKQYYEAKITGPADFEYNESTDFFSGGKMELQIKRVYAACEYKEADCSAQGQAEWIRSHGSKAINYECQDEASEATDATR